MDHDPDLDLYACPDCGSMMSACDPGCHDNRTGGDETLIAAMGELQGW